MAVYPCAFEAHRYAGPQRAAYLTVVDGLRPATRKLRLCPAHSVRVLADVKAALQELDENSSMAMVCDRCPEPRSESVYARVYLENGDPLQYVGDFCPDHGRDALASMHWDIGITL